MFQLHQHFHMLNVHLYIPCFLCLNIFTLSNSYSVFKAKLKCPFVWKVSRQSFLPVGFHIPFSISTHIIFSFFSFLLSSPYFCFFSLFLHNSSPFSLISLKFIMQAFTVSLIPICSNYLTKNSWHINISVTGPLALLGELCSFS